VGRIQLFLLLLLLLLGEVHLLIFDCHQFLQNSTVLNSLVTLGKK
jgi:hypothetical protein